MNFIPKKKFWRSSSVQIVLIALLFWGVHSYRIQGMHEKGDTLEQTFMLPKLEEGGRISLHRIPEPNATKRQLLYFVAPWCGVCHLSLPNLDAIYREGADLDIRVIVLSYDNPEQVVEMISKLDLSLPVYMGSEQLHSYYKINVFPSYYLLSNELEVVALDQGYNTQLGLNWRLNP